MDNKPEVESEGETDILLEEKLEFGVLQALACGSISQEEVDTAQRAEFDDSLGWM